MSISPHRSFETIQIEDLARLYSLALGDIDDLCRRKEHSRRFRDAIVLACLCQGSAQHYVHQNRGVQDFDIWFFFQKSDGPDFPHRRRGKVDFGPSRFGANPEDRGFKGRRVDVIGRSIAADDLAPTAAVIRYLEGAATSSAWHLAQRPVVVVSPGVDFGRVIWDGLNNEPWVRTDG